jgi:acyl carrier protein
VVSIYFGSKICLNAGAAGEGWIMLMTKVADAIVSVMGCERELIVAQANLIDLGIDSLKAINIVFELEEEFDIEIPNEVF